MGLNYQSIRVHAKAIWKTVILVSFKNWFVQKYWLHYNNFDTFLRQSIFMSKADVKICKCAVSMNLTNLIKSSLVTMLLLKCYC